MYPDRVSLLRPTRPALPLRLLRRARASRPRRQPALVSPPAQKAFEKEPEAQTRKEECPDLALKRQRIVRGWELLVLFLVTGWLISVLLLILP